MGEAHVKGKVHLKQLKETLGNCDLVLCLEKKIVDRKSILAELNNEYNKLNLIFELKGYLFISTPKSPSLMC